MKHYDWEIRGAPIRVEVGPRDISSGKCVVTLRTGGKSDESIEGISHNIAKLLDSVSGTLRKRAQKFYESLVHPLPVDPSDGRAISSDEIEDGVVYELAFDGNDSDAEALEKLTGLTLLGECDEPLTQEAPCAISGKLTTKRQHVARMY